MFPTKETTENQSNQERGFESVDHFAQWLDAELAELVSKFDKFKTNKSVRKYLSRS